MKAFLVQEGKKARDPKEPNCIVKSDEPLIFVVPVDFPLVPLCSSHQSLVVGVEATEIPCDTDLSEE